MPNKSISFNAEAFVSIAYKDRTQFREICHAANEAGLDEVFPYPQYSERTGDDFSDNDFDYIFTPRYKSGEVYSVNNSELKIKIKKVKLEKLQDISDKDILSEGIKPLSENYPNLYKDYLKDTYWTTSIKTSFRSWWNYIHKKSISERWHKNPWVWVYEFEKIAN